MNHSIVVRTENISCLVTCFHSYWSIPESDGSNNINAQTLAVLGLKRNEHKKVMRGLPKLELHG